MQVDRFTLEKIAHLARLEIEEEEVETYLKDISSVLTWMNKLNQLDTSNIEPLSSLSSESDRTRRDVINQQLTKKHALENAPSHDNNFFRVPKIIE